MPSFKSGPSSSKELKLPLVKKRQFNLPATSSMSWLSLLPLTPQNEEQLVLSLLDAISRVQEQPLALQVSNQ